MDQLYSQCDGNVENNCEIFSLSSYEIGLIGLSLSIIHIEKWAFKYK